jgi:small subunit ribosomal protein S4
MGRYLGPKLRLRQRFGLAEASASIRRQGQFKSRKSGYGLILEEKQKLKFIYGLMEKQMRRYVAEAFAGQGDPRIMLLDNVVYRLGLARTREQARQFVGHGHILVDNKKVDIPSYILREGQIISFNDKVAKKTIFKTLIETSRKEIEAAGFLSLEEGGGRFLHTPQEADLPKNVDMAKVLEFYHKML